MKKSITLQQKILSSNDLLAQKIHKRLDKNHIFSINIMASPGAGKTTLINKTIEKLKTKFKIAVIDGDICDLDLKKLKKHKIPLVLANSGGNCHLDATMINKALNKLDLKNIDLLIIENIGNLICPASFDLGTHKNIIIASVPEGDDKPYKYPAMYKGADALILNKIDYLEDEEFNLKYFKRGVKRLNPNLEFFPLSAKKGKGINKWIEWLTKQKKPKNI